MQIADRRRDAGIAVGVGQGQPGNGVLKRVGITLRRRCGDGRRFIAGQADKDGGAGALGAAHQIGAVIVVADGDQVAGGGGGGRGVLQSAQGGVDHGLGAADGHTAGAIAGDGDAAARRDLKSAAVGGEGRGDAGPAERVGHRYPGNGVVIGVVIALRPGHRHQGGVVAGHGDIDRGTGALAGVADADGKDVAAGRGQAGGVGQAG